MKTFIAGASGFVGSNLLQALATMGPLVALSRRTTGRRSFRPSSGSKAAEHLRLQFCRN